jgi:hypothetical protein
MPDKIFRKRYERRITPLTIKASDVQFVDDAPQVPELEFPTKEPDTWQIEFIYDGFVFWRRETFSSLRRGGL